MFPRESHERMLCDITLLNINIEGFTNKSCEHRVND